MKRLTIRKQDQEKIFNAEYAWAPNFDGSFTCELEDERRLPEIAADFDEIEEIEYINTDTHEQSYDYSGYNTLVSINRVRGLLVSVKLIKMAVNE